jgi:hypothetical protein
MRWGLIALKKRGKIFYAKELISIIGNLFFIISLVASLTFTLSVIF